jgi:hypothetical protein
MGKSNHDILIIGVAAVALLLVSGILKIDTGQTQSALNGGSGGSGGAGGAGGVGYATTLTAGSVDALTGGVEDVNAQIYSSDGTFYTTETGVLANPTSLSTSAPNSLAGFLMIGNDNGESTTDQGADVYYRKVPFTYVQKGTFNVPDVDGGANIKLYNESTVTWTGYDDGTTEATLNVTVGAAATTSSTELKLSSATARAIGNPEFANPIAVCFNASTNADWDEIKPLNYVATVDAPEALSSYNIHGDCYVLPTGALKDGAEYRFYVQLDAATGYTPGSSDWIFAFVLDKTYYLDDNSVWQSGFSDDSYLGTDRDPGIAAITNEKRISLND